MHMLENEKLDLIISDLQVLKSDVGILKNKVNSIELTLENVTNRNISIIAENHIDLLQKLNDALKSERQKEMMLIRTNYLEDEIRKIKDQLSHTA